MTKQLLLPLSIFAKTSAKTSARFVTSPTLGQTLLMLFGIFFIQNATAQTYCASKGTAPWTEWISNVQIGSINNASQKEGYGNFTSQATDLAKGTSYPLSITQGFSWAADPSLGTQQGRAWIDYNKNGTFEDAEIVASFTRSVTTANIVIPATATTGATRMRISLKTIGLPTACETFDKGEVEDYTVNITGSTGGGTSNLLITNVTGPASSLPGNQVTLAVTLTNTGTAPTVATNLYYFQDALITVPVRLSPSTVTVAPLAPNETRVVNFPLTLINPINPPNAAYFSNSDFNNFKFGDYYVWASNNVSPTTNFPVFNDPKFLFNIAPIFPQANISVNVVPNKTTLATGERWNATYTVKNNSTLSIGQVFVNLGNFANFARNSFPGLYAVDSSSNVPAMTRVVQSGAESPAYGWEVLNLAAGETRTVKLNFSTVIPRSSPSTPPPTTTLPFPTVNRSSNVVNTNTTVGTPITIIYDATPALVLPDLTLANLNAGVSTVEQGQNLNFNADFKNIGTVAATGNFTVKSYLSVDQFLSADDYQNGSIPTANYAAGQTVLQVAGAMNVNSTVAAGQYFLILKIDADDQIAETFESNNTIWASPRITVTTAVTGGGNYCASKGTAPWEYAISNVQIGTLNNTSDKFKDIATLGYSDYTNLATTLNKGTSYPLSITPLLSWIGNIPNTFCRVWIDFNQNKTFEASELVLEKTNANPLTQSVLIPTTALTGATRMRVSLKNGAYPTACETFEKGEVEDYTVNIAGGTGGGNQPDLTLNGGISPQVINGQSLLQFGNVTLKNAGSAATIAPFNVNLYLSTDATLSATDLLTSKAAISANLAAGDSVSVPLSAFSIPNDVIAGNYFFIFKADGDNNIVESNENNNTLNNAAVVRNPNLTASFGAQPAIAVNATVTRGETFTLTHFKGSFFTGSRDFIRDDRFGVIAYLSTDTVLSTNDFLISETTEPFQFDATSAGFAVFNTSLVPTTFASGAYYIVYELDNTNTVRESNETDNKQYIRINWINGTINGTPNFTITNVTGLASAAPGTQITLAVTVKNTGTSATLPTALYYTQPQTNPSQLVLTDNVLTVAPLAVNETRVVNYTLTLKNSIYPPNARYISGYSDPFEFGNYEVIANAVLNPNGTPQLSATAARFVYNFTPIFPQANISVSVVPNKTILRLGETWNAVYTIKNNSTTLIKQVFFNLGSFQRLSRNFLSPNFEVESIGAAPVNSFTKRTVGEIETIGVDMFDLAAGESRSITLNFSRILTPREQGGRPDTIATGTLPFPFVNTASNVVNTNTNVGSPISIFVNPPIATNLPDLTISNLVVPSTTVQVGAGRVLGFTFDVGNSSTVAVPNVFRIKSYFSTDQTLSANDLVRGDFSTGNYNAGFSVNVGNSIDATIPEGQYYLIVKIDADNTILESNENNNIVVSPLLTMVSSTGGSGGSDIALSLTSTPSVYRQYTTQNFRITATNSGTTAFSNVKIKFTRPALTASGGTKVASIGTFQDFCPGGIECSEWTIPTLAGGATATLDAPIFILAPTGAITATANLLNSTPTDNSTANNTATVTINSATAPITQPLVAYKPTQLIPIVIQKVNPTLADGEITVELESLIEKTIDFGISNSMGQQVMLQQIAVERGMNKVGLDVSQLPQGLYFIQTNVGKGRNVPTKFVKL